MRNKGNRPVCGDVDKDGGKTAFEYTGDEDALGRALRWSKQRMASRKAARLLFETTAMVI